MASPFETAFEADTSRIRPFFSAGYTARSSKLVLWSYWSLLFALTQSP